MPEQPLTIDGNPASTRPPVPAPRGLALLAEHDGLAIAAIALTSGAVAADAARRPPTPSATAAAAPLPAAAPGRRRRPARSLLRRLAPVAPDPPQSPSPTEGDPPRCTPSDPSAAPRSAPRSRAPRSSPCRQWPVRLRHASTPPPRTSTSRTTAAPSRCTSPARTASSPSGTAPAARGSSAAATTTSRTPRTPIGSTSSDRSRHSADGYVIDESVNRLGPGAITEPTGGSEIEVTAFTTGGVRGRLEVLGSSQRDIYRVDSNGFVDLGGDGDGDFSITAGATEVRLAGAGGPDILSGQSIANGVATREARPRRRFRGRQPEGRDRERHVPRRGRERHPAAPSTTSSTPCPAAPASTGPSWTGSSTSSPTASRMSSSSPRSGACASRPRPSRPRRAGPRGWR